MPPAISITESNILTALRTFLLSVVSSGCEVVKGQANRVPSPQSADYVVMTSLMRTRLATNVDTYSDPYPAPGGTQNAKQSTRVTVQLDIHGPLSADNAQVITTMLRDDYACQSFKNSGFDIQPLYASDPKQMPFITGEAQYEDRWTIDAELQASPVVTVSQDFAGTLGPVGLINVEATYPVGEN